MIWGTPKLSGLLAVFFCMSAAHSYEMDGQIGYTEVPEHLPKVSRNYVSTMERIDKFEAALKELNLPLESTPEILNELPGNGAVSESEVRRILPWIDSNGALFDYLSFNEGRLSLYRDFYTPTLSSKYQEYSVVLNRNEASSDNLALLKKFEQIADQIHDEKPLSGLVIALDPGHMGGDTWDENTGKFVQYKNYKKVSEGELNLYTAYLLANQLRALGADVILTREQLTPVTPWIPYDRKGGEKMPSYLEPFRLKYFYNAFDTWMTPFNGSALASYIDAFKRKLTETDASSTNPLQKYFIAGADLQARVDEINRARPDITFDIHYDAYLSKPPALRKSNEIKTYVPGGIMNTVLGADNPYVRETGSRLSKALALKQLLEPNRWDQSVRLASSVVKAMSATTGVPIKKDSHGGQAALVTDGVYARNLYLTLNNTQGLMVYLECLNYDNVKEYHLMRVKNKMGSYLGNTFYYPSRLDKVAYGIRQGVLNYFASIAAQKNAAQQLKN